MVTNTQKIAIVENFIDTNKHGIQILQRVYDKYDAMSVEEKSKVKWEALLGIAVRQEK